MRMPVLPTFQARIAELKEEEAEIKAIEGVKTEGWLRIDCKPTKTALATLVSKWSEAHTSYLKDHVHKYCDVESGSPV